MLSQPEAKEWLKKEGGGPSPRQDRLLAAELPVRYFRLGLGAQPSLISFE